MPTTDWALSVDFDSELPLTDGQLDTLSDRGDQDDITVARRVSGGYSLRETLAADNPLAAAEDLVQLGLKWAMELAIHANFVSVAVLRADLAEADVLAPSIPDLASAADAAEILGVSRQRIHQLAGHHPRFPAAVSHVAMGPLWTVDAINWFASIWDRKPGRRPGSRSA